jgi:predicted ester cyclase
VDHGLAPGLTLQGPEGAKEAVTQFRTAFSDLRLDVDQLVAEGDKVFTYWIARGTHDGPLRTPAGDIPPSGKTGIVHGMTLNRLVDRRIIEAWDNFDTLGMLQQLGVIPVRG